MIKKIAGSWIIQLFCILWATFLFLDYINASSYFYDAFNYFEYADLLFTLLVFTALFTYLFSNKKKINYSLEIKNFRGIYHYLFTLSAMGLIIFFSTHKMNLSPSPGSGTIVFIFKTLLFHLGVALILLASLSTGIFLLDRLSIKTEKYSFILISLALGLIAITTGLFMLGAFGLLYQVIVFPFILVLLIPGRKKLPTLLRDIFVKKSTPFEIHFLAILAYAFLIVFVALCLCFATRTIPIGFDGLILYMNIPKLIAGYHGLTNGGDAYNWSLLMSLGFILYNNTTITILLSVIPGILSICAMYRICSNLNINRNWSLFACTLFYSLPNLTWLSRTEEKVDLAMLFFILCFVLLFIGKRSNNDTPNIKSQQKKQVRFSADSVFWALCGILLGFAFGIKYISMLSIFASLLVLFYMYSGKYGALTIFFLNFAIIFGLDLTRFAAFEKDLMFLRFIVPFTLSIIFFLVAIRKKRKDFLEASKLGLVFTLFIALTFLPWAIKHISENKNFSVESILYGKSPLPPLFTPTSNTYGFLPPKAKDAKRFNDDFNDSDKSFSAFGFSIFTNNSLNNFRDFFRNINTTDVTGTANPVQKESTNAEKHEEIRRFLGYETGIIRFISLPYRIIMKSNVRLVTSDAGILLLLIIPVFIFSFSVKQLPWNILKMIFLLLILIVSMHSVQLMIDHGDKVLSTDLLQTTDFSRAYFINNIIIPFYELLKQKLLSAGTLLKPLYDSLTLQPLGICFILLVLFSIPVYFIFKTSLYGLNELSRIFIAFVYSTLQYWLVLSSGIIWYGITGFSLVFVSIALLASKKDMGNADNFIKRYIVACAIIWCALILPYQFIPAKYLTTSDPSKIDFNEFIDPQFVKYAIGEQNEKEVLKHFLNDAQLNIVNTLNHDKNARLFNISTYLNYYIVNNDSRVYLDNQLGMFKDIYNNVNSDKTLLAGQFKKANIKYILVGLRTPEIDRTPEKSLTKKFNELMIALVNNAQVHLLYTDRLVARPDGDLDINFNGTLVKAKYDMVGVKVIDQGTDALFEIL